MQETNILNREYLQNILDDFNFGKIQCPKIKTVQISKASETLDVQNYGSTAYGRRRDTSYYMCTSEAGIHITYTQNTDTCSHYTFITSTVIINKMHCQNNKFKGKMSTN